MCWAISVGQHHTPDRKAERRRRSHMNRDFTWLVKREKGIYSVIISVSRVIATIAGVGSEEQ